MVNLGKPSLSSLEESQFALLCWLLTAVLCEFIYFDDLCSNWSDASLLELVIYLMHGLMIDSDCSFAESSKFH